MHSCPEGLLFLFYREFREISYRTEKPQTSINAKSAVTIYLHSYVSKLLAMSIVNITAVLNTPLVCIGGIISEFNVDLENQISSYIQGMVPYPPAICLSEMGSMGFIPGALHLGAEEILAQTINSNTI